jgi:hypothetical protein
MVALEAKQNQIFDVGRQALASRAYKKGNVMAEPYMDWTLNRKKKPHFPSPTTGTAGIFNLLFLLSEPPADPHGKYRQPCKPAVNKNSVPLAYESRQPLAQPSFYQPTMDMKGVETVLNV